MRPHRSRLFSVLVLVVLTLWSAASVHCELEAAGLTNLVTLDNELNDDGCCDPSEDCSRDACGLVENADYAQPLADLKAPPPSLSIELCLACLHASLAERPALSTPPPAFTTDRHPPIWLPDRHNVRRAAPPARAPTARV